MKASCSAEFSVLPWSCVINYQGGRAVYIWLHVAMCNIPSNCQIIGPHLAKQNRTTLWNACSILDTQHGSIKHVWVLLHVVYINHGTLYHFMIVLYVGYTCVHPCIWSVVFLRAKVEELLEMVDRQKKQVRLLVLLYATELYTSVLHKCLSFLFFKHGDSFMYKCQRLLDDMYFF